MKIKFEVSRTNRSKTDCPYGYIDGYEGSIKKVGSYACSDCINHVSQDNYNMVVECDAENTIRNRK